jgi:hypothetical protein
VVDSAWEMEDALKVCIDSPFYGII